MMTLPGSRSAVSVPAAPAPSVPVSAYPSVPERFSRSTRSRRSIVAVARDGVGSAACGASPPPATSAPATTSPAAATPPVASRRLISRRRRSRSGIVLSQAFCASWNFGLSGSMPLPGPIRTRAPPLASKVGSGKLMPCSRMHFALASAALRNSPRSSSESSGALTESRYFAHAFSAVRILPASTFFGPLHHHAVAVELRVGHVDPVLAHAAREVEHRLLVGVRARRRRGRAGGIVAAAGGERGGRRDGGDEQTSSHPTMEPVGDEMAFS